jgi:hypothetical protein
VAIAGTVPPAGEMNMSYEPAPLDTTGVVLTEEVQDLLEVLARHVHDVWSRQRLRDGWHYGSERDDLRKEHPSLVPYEQLSEAEKDYDRHTAAETLKAIIALGYRITRA